MKEKIATRYGDAHDREMTFFSATAEQQIAQHLNIAVQKLISRQYLEREFACVYNLILILKAIDGRLWISGPSEEELTEGAHATESPLPKVAN